MLASALVSRLLLLSTEVTVLLLGSTSKHPVIPMFLGKVKF